mgnify:CR=1 FL=1
MLNIKKTALTIGVVGLAALPLLSLAVPAAGPVSPINTIQEVSALLNRILTIIYVIFFVIASIFIILAAFSYLTAGGDEEKTTQAKAYLYNGLIGMVIILASYGLSRFVVTSIISATFGG